MSCFQNSASVGRIILGVISHLNNNWKDYALPHLTHIPRNTTATLPTTGLGPVHTKQPEFDTIQVWKLQKLSTNA